MSLYNMMHGYNPLAGILLPMLDLTPDDVGRFRDCYLARAEDGTLEIHVYTRNGGGNREDHEVVFETLARHPQYLRDRDDDFDCTYATIAFRVPPQFMEPLMDLVAVSPDSVPASPAERFQAFMTKLQTQPNDPDVQRVTEAVRPMLEKLISE